MRKFGVFDGVLAVLLVAGIAANVYVYGFYDKDVGDGGQGVFGDRAATAESPRGGADSPEPDVDVPARGGGSQTQGGEAAAQGGGTRAQSGDNTAQDGAEQAAGGDSTAAGTGSQDAAVSQDPSESAPPEPTPASSTTPAGFPSGDPAAADFAWFIDSVRTSGVPGDASPITDMSVIFGDWKMILLIDPDHVASSDSSYMLANVNIDEIGGAIMFEVQKLTMVDESGFTQDLSRADADLYWGEYLPPNYTGIYAGETWYRFTVTDFYVKDGKQYGVGVNEVQSGEPCYIALIRP